MSNEEKIEKLRELVNLSFKEDFNFELEHWENGSYDDSYDYGVEVGEQYMLQNIIHIIEQEK